MPVDIAPLMDHPAWKGITPAQRAAALKAWQDPAATDSSRAEMRQIMDELQADLAQQPSAPASLVSTAQSILQDAPGWVNRNLGVLGRAAGQDPNAPPGTWPQTSQEQEAALLPMQQNIEKGATGITGLMAGPAWGKAGYKAGETILSKLTPALANRPMAQTVANALPAVGEAGGNYLSRQANVVMGTEQPGVAGDIASAALPLAVRGATSAPVARRLPGSAVTQHEMAADDLGEMVTGMQPKTPAGQLYTSLAQGTNPTIPAQNLRNMAEELIKKEMAEDPSVRNGDVVTMAQGLVRLAEQYGDNVPLDRMYSRMQRIGERLGGAARTDDIGTKELSRMYAGFHEALEDAAGSNIPEADTLRQAIKASRQEHAVERLERITGQGRGIGKQQETGYTLVSGKKMLGEFERLVADDDVFRGSFTADELADMRKVFEGSVKLPNLPPPRSAQRGAGKAALAGSIGGGIGYAVAGEQGAKLGAMAGIAAPEAIARLMTTSGGRAVLKAAFEGRDTLTPEVVAVINQAARMGPEVVEQYTSKRSGTSAP